MGMGLQWGGWWLKNLLCLPLCVCPHCSLCGMKTFPLHVSCDSKGSTGPASPSQVLLGGDKITVLAFSALASLAIVQKGFSPPRIQLWISPPTTRQP